MRISGDAVRSAVTTLHTRRLVLRQWRAEDLAPYAELNADPVVREHFPSVMTREQSDAHATRCEALLALRGWGLWAVEVKAGEPFIGFVGLNEPAGDLPYAPAVELGWRLARDQWGNGYATEAARAALVHAFDVLRAPQVVSATTEANLRSRSVMERLGMRHDPGGDFDHPRLPTRSPLSRHVLYRIERPIVLAD